MYLIGPSDTCRGKKLLGVLTKVCLLMVVSFYCRIKMARPLLRIARNVMHDRKEKSEKPNTDFFLWLSVARFTSQRDKRHQQLCFALHKPTVLRTSTLCRRHGMLR